MLEKNNLEITGNGLKLIAIITMFIDHFAVALYSILAYRNGWDISFLGIDLYSWMRLIGRMAFPIYCFLVVEGFYHTRDFRKYAIRLLALATISEFPFDLAVNFHSSYFLYNNVIFTLLIGLLTIGEMEYVRSGKIEKINTNLLKTLATILIFLVGCLLAYIMKTDYGAVGVATIVVMYLLYGNTKYSRMLEFAAGVLILFLGSNSTEAAAFLMLIPIAFYKGNRGSKSPVIKYTFNLFYPVHLLILGLVAFYMI